jgi:DNA relaxase NicK
MNHVFTLTIDWLAFTVSDASAHEVIRVLGGDWTKGKAGFRGYPISWIVSDSSRGVGLLGTGAPRRPREVHVDLSAGIVSAWPLKRVRDILNWIVRQAGQITRIDCALDDREGQVPVGVVKEAAEVGQCITRVDQARVIKSFSLHKGTAFGDTIYFGSPQSQTLLRVYDKRLELLAKRQADWETYGVRWELEFKKKRAQACAKGLLALQEADWKEFVVGLLRSYVDFRDTTRDAAEEDRARASRLPWYEALTEGFKTAKLTVEQATPQIEKVKQWVKQSIAPMLAVICAHDAAGQAWLEHVIVEASGRWKDKHLQLAMSQHRKEQRDQHGGPSGTL